MNALQDLIPLARHGLFFLAMGAAAWPLAWAVRKACGHWGIVVPPLPSRSAWLGAAAAAAGLGLASAASFWLMAPHLGEGAARLATLTLSGGLLALGMSWLVPYLPRLKAFLHGLAGGALSYLAWTFTLAGSGEGTARVVLASLLLCLIAAAVTLPLPEAEPVEEGEYETPLYVVASDRIAVDRRRINTSRRKVR